LGEYPFKVIVEHWEDIAYGLVVTIEVSLLAMILSITLGVILGVARVLPSRPVRVCAGAYVEFFRNIPPLVHLFFFFFGLPRLGIVMSPLMCGVLGLAMYHAGYVAEILRAGIEIVGRNQMEAGRALGFSFFGAMRHAVLPQAVWVVLPPLGNLYVSLFKTSALVATIGVTDLMYEAEILHERTFRTFEVFAFVGLVYIALSMLLGAALHALEEYTHARRVGRVA
jgi:His/Glu/Gln/Arg/opine family amino acid ABC transporter permease subunit